MLLWPYSILLESLYFYYAADKSFILLLSGTSIWILKFSYFWLFLWSFLCPLRDYFIYYYWSILETQHTTYLQQFRILRSSNIFVVLLDICGYFTLDYIIWSYVVFENFTIEVYFEVCIIFVEVFFDQHFWNYYKFWQYVWL